MPYYEDPTTKQQTYIGNPELNPNLVQGKTLIGDTINSDVLSSQTNLSSQVSYPQPQSVFPVASLDSSFQLTQPEQKAEDFSTQLQKLNEQLLGQSAFKTGQEQAQGVPELQKTQADLVGRLKTLQAEALQIPLQLQQEATGRGITAGGLRPIEQAALRTNAIQALSVGALLEASRGQLTTALDLVDRAVNQKYDPIKEQIAVKQANLDIILKSPSYSLAEKKRAEQQKAIQADQLKNLKQQEQNETEIMQIAINAVQGGADALTLRNIQRASSPQEALQLAAPFLQKKEQNSFEQRLDPQGNLVELELTPQGQVVNQRVITGKEAGTITGVNDPITTPEGKTLVYGTPEYVIQKLLNTSSSKTKPVASEREQLGKFANVVALTDNLMTSLNKTTNDPIFGYLKSLNPYDFDARAVNAQVTALVPSVARALYGEVGVLTDTDIERYLTTLPNIRSTDEQNKFIALMTLTNAKRSYEQTLLNLANSNVNVAGFADSYKDITNKVELLEKELKIGEQNISGEDEAVFDEVVSPKTGGYFSNLWNALFGK